MSVSIKYKGNEIAKLTEAGIKTLKTEGKYCEGDIVVEKTSDGATVADCTYSKFEVSEGNYISGFTLKLKSAAFAKETAIAKGGRVDMTVKGSNFGNARRADVLDGKKFTSYYSINKVGYEGTMTNNGAKTLEITDADTAVAIPKGYHNGSGSAKIADAEKAKLTEENIREGVTILGKTGTLKVANLQDEKSISVTANGTVEVTPDEGYDGVKKVSVEVNVPSSGGEIGATVDASVMGLASGTAKVIFEMPDGVIGGVGLTPNASVNFETKVGSVVVVVASDAMYIDGDSSNGIEVLPTNYNNRPFAAGESGYIAAAKVTEDAPTIVLG